MVHDLLVVVLVAVSTKVTPQLVTRNVVKIFFVGVILVSVTVKCTLNNEKKNIYEFWCIGKNANVKNANLFAFVTFTFLSV